MVIILAAAVVSVFAANAQKLTIGERAPEIRIKEWLTERINYQGTPLLLDFYHSSSKECDSNLAVLDGYAAKYGSGLNIMVIARESREKVEGALLGSPHKFSAVLDDGGRTFNNFAIQFVPFSVLIDGRGRVIWFGNPALLTNDILSRAVK